MTHHSPRSFIPPQRSSGWDRFNRFFRDVFGDRWFSLRAALEDQVNHIALLNPWEDCPEVVTAMPEVSEAEGLHGCLELPRQRDFPGPSTFEGLELYPYYLLDGASVMAARAMEVADGDRVLDMCSAPGGKTFALTHGLGEEGTLVANDVDDRRRLKLKRTLDRYLPERVRAQISLAGQDATRWSARERDAYDRVLVDAPCSSERHLLHQGSMIDRWNEWRTEEMARTQYAMLSGALDVVKPGGRVVYSTCSISPKENDGVLARLLKRRGDQVTVESPNIVWGEPTEHGWQILPDVTGWGPMYVSVLRRTL